MEIRIEELPERTVAVVHHSGPIATVDATRRPLYRHMVSSELVGGPSILRVHPDGRPGVDALVMTHTGFSGDAVCEVEILPAGPYAVADYEGPAHALDAARNRFAAWVQTQRVPAPPILQVHLMDEVDGATEQQFQAYLGT